MDFFIRQVFPCLQLRQGAKPRLFDRRPIGLYWRRENRNPRAPGRSTALTAVRLRWRHHTTDDPRPRLTPVQSGDAHYRRQVSWLAGHCGTSAFPVFRPVALLMPTIRQQLRGQLRLQQSADDCLNRIPFSSAA